MPLAVPCPWQCGALMWPKHVNEFLVPYDYILIGFMSFITPVITLKQVVPAILKHTCPSARGSGVVPGAWSVIMLCVCIALHYDGYIVSSENYWMYTL